MPVSAPRTAVPASLADRKRQLVRDELSDAAMKLFASQGFEETTIERIVDAAGVSRRTFFRYFNSKEDVIVEFLGEMGVSLGAELAGRPREETAATALRHALAVVVSACTEHPQKALALTKLTMDTPALRARYLDQQRNWRAGLAGTLAERSGLDPERDLRPTLVAGVALLAWDTSLAAWAAGDAADDLGELLDVAFAHVADALRLDPADAGRVRGRR